MIYKAIIADDEKELRTYLRSMLDEVWPELTICGEAANGKEALALVESERPEIAFLDIKMPGLSGMDVATRIAGLCRIVFVTAFDQYAVEAFEKEAVDYLLKPVSKQRLAQTAERLKGRMESPAEPQQTPLGQVIEGIVATLSGKQGQAFLRWIRVQNHETVRLVAVEEVDYFKAEDKYTVVVTRQGESLIRRSIRDLAQELDPAQFWQIHRGTIVNVSRIDTMSRSITGRGVLRLKGRPEQLTVSRNYLPLFNQM